MPNLLLDLPAEILANTLSFLPAHDLESCKLINHYIRNTISGSARLCYLIALGNACFEDNPYNHLSTPEKLEALTQREFAWRSFQPDFVQSITVDHPSSGIYDLTNGVYFLGALDGFSLHYLELPALPSQTLAWSRIDIDRKIVDIGLAIHESNLIAIITSGSDPNATNPADPMLRLELSLLSFETGQPHPLAETSTILIGSTQLKPSISIEIMGNHIALVTTYRFHESPPPDRLYLWNWRTGALLIDCMLGHQTHSSVTFLTADLLLLSNTERGTFEFWSIPDPHLGESCHPAYAISLPPLSPGMSILAIGSRGEPGPVGPNSSFDSGRPFHASPQQAIIIFRIHIGSASEEPEQFALTLVAHRQTLIDIFNKHISETSPDGDSDHVAQWSDWGPPVTRWITAEGTPSRWITTASGQRYVTILTDTAFPIVIYDFNPRNLAKMKDYLQQHVDPAMFYSDEEEKLYDSESIFEVPVYSALPYCGYESEGQYVYNGVFIDEERLAGIKTDDSGAIISVDVMHFG